jgi:hypothetical protein
MSYWLHISASDCPRLLMYRSLSYRKWVDIGRVHKKLRQADSAVCLLRFHNLIARLPWREAVYL